jgi:rhomboid protease GluP
LPLVELVRLSSPTEAEGWSFTLQVAGIASVVAPVSEVTNGSGRHWAVLVEEADLARAREILIEEGVLPGPSVEAPKEVSSPPRLYWVVGLILINALVFWAMESSGGSETQAVLHRFGASHAPSIFAGAWWRLVTAIFLHIGGRHLLANMVSLAIFGPFVLRSFGVGRFFFMYVTSGLSGNLLSLAISPRPSYKAGASGAILGLFGVLAGSRIRGLRSPRAPTRYKPWHILAVVLAYYGFVVGLGPADHLAHVGGILAGIALGLLIPPPGGIARNKELFLEFILGGIALALVATSGVLAYRAGG